MPVPYNLSALPHSPFLSLPPLERQKIEKDFEGLITQTPFSGEKYQKKGLKDGIIKGIFVNIVGEQLLTKNERDFKKYMESIGQPVEEDRDGWKFKR